MPAQFEAGQEAASWGQALGKASEAFQVIAKKTAEANDTRQLIEAEGAMRRHAMEFQQFQQTTTDQELWLPEWQKRQTEMQKQMDGMKLTDGARLRLTSSFGRWSDSNAIAIQGEAFKQAVSRSLQAVDNRAGEAADAGDRPGIDSALSLAMEGSMTPEQKEDRRMQFYKRADAADLKAENDAANAFLLQETPDLESAVAVFENSALMSKDEKIIAKAKATQFYTEKVETQKNKASAALYGKVNYDAANGIFPDATEINWRVAEGEMTVDHATPILEGIKRRGAGLPANSAKFNDFINNRVLTYDPTKDTTGAEFEKIQREAAEIGIDQFQAQRFMSNIDAVVKRNTTSAGRSESAKRKWMLDGVQELMKSGAFGEYKTRSEEPAAQSLLRMPGKLQQFGLSAKEAERVAKTTGPQQLELFQEFAKSRFKTEHNKRVAVFDQAQYDLLEEGEKELFNQAVSGKFAGGEVIGGKALEASLKAAELNDRIEGAFDEFIQTQKRTPTQKEAVQMFHDITGSDRRQSAWFPQIVPDQASNDPGRYQVEPDGSFSGTASSYGYEGDADTGFNSVGMKRGQQPWYGEHPTVALAPSTAESLGVQLPRPTKDGWDTSKSLVEIELNGKKVKAIFDETGMYINPNSKNKLVDLTPEASAALGVKIKENVSGVKIRKASK